MIHATIHITQAIQWLAVLAAAAWILIAAFIADYGRDRGFPFLPLFICAFFPLPGPLFTLLAVTVAGPRRP